MIMGHVGDTAFFFFVFFFLPWAKKKTTKNKKKKKQYHQVTWGIRQIRGIRSQKGKLVRKKKSMINRLRYGSFISYPIIISIEHTASAEYC